MVKQELAFKETLSCVQCGYCLPACPTYITFKKEKHSPRGRINLVKMAAEGKISYEDMEQGIELCLGCRACETACPSNVPYGTILESAVASLATYNKEKMKKRQKLIQYMLFEQTIPNKKVLNIGEVGLSLYQKTGVQKAVRKSKILNVFPEKIKAFENILPEVERHKRQSFYESKQLKKFNVGFFTGCVMDTMFKKINTLSIKLLQEAHCDVSVVPKQGCCGALHNHSGEHDLTIQLAKHNIEIFEKHQFDYIVNSIGGCGAMLIEYDVLLKNDSKWAERAKAFAEKVVDISVLLNQVDLPFKKSISQLVTYQPSCHMTNVQKCVAPPVNLIQKIPGISYVPLLEKDMCCGSAGIYNFINYDASMKILDEKMLHVKNTLHQEKAWIITSNPGCHLQMKLGIEREKMNEKVEVYHLVEVLADACDIHI